MIFVPEDRRVRASARARCSPTCCSPTRSTARPAKVQSALLEAMQERQVTLGDTSHRAADAVPASSPPRTRSSRKGTYPLPEAQVDRFLLKAKVDYPKHGRGAADLRPHDQRRDARRCRACCAPTRCCASQQRVREIYIDERLRDYMVSLVDRHARGPRDLGLVDLAPLIAYGASPARDPGVLRGVAGRRVPARPWLRRPRGREGDRQGRAAPPHPAHLRGRGRERHHRHGGRSILERVEVLASRVFAPEPGD